MINYTKNLKKCKITRKKINKSKKRGGAAAAHVMDHLTLGQDIINTYKGKPSQHIILAYFHLDCHSMCIQRPDRIINDGTVFIPKFFKNYMHKEEYNQYNKDSASGDIISYVPNNLTVSFNTHCNPNNSVHGNFTIDNANRFLRNYHEKFNVEVEPFISKPRNNQGIKLSYDGGETGYLINLKRGMYMNDIPLVFYDNSKVTGTPFMGCGISIFEIGESESTIKEIETNGKLPPFADKLKINSKLLSINGYADKYKKKPLYLKQVLALIGIYCKKKELKYKETYENASILPHVILYTCRGEGKPKRCANRHGLLAQNSDTNNNSNNRDSSTRRSRSRSRSPN